MSRILDAAGMLQRSGKEHSGQQPNLQDQLQFDRSRPSLCFNIARLQHQMQQQQFAPPGTYSLSETSSSASLIASPAVSAPLPTHVAHRHLAKCLSDPALHMAATTAQEMIRGTDFWRALRAGVDVRKHAVPGWRDGFSGSLVLPYAFSDNDVTSSEAGDDVGAGGSARRRRWLRKPKPVSDDGKGMVTLFIDADGDSLCWCKLGQPVLRRDPRYAIRIGDVRHVCVAPPSPRDGRALPAITLSTPTRILSFSVDGRALHALLADTLRSVADLNAALFSAAQRPQHRPFYSASAFGGSGGGSSGGGGSGGAALYASTPASGGGGGARLPPLSRASAPLDHVLPPPRVPRVAHIGRLSGGLGVQRRGSLDGGGGSDGARGLPPRSASVPFDLHAACDLSAVSAAAAVEVEVLARAAAAAAEAAAPAQAAAVAAPGAACDDDDVTGCADAPQPEVPQ
ncbi:hypothetical protein JKP88DRAFT_350994 [Tribonema minus]|uniref:Uncharacterized protein n=1 Tax=Tribonema minus TaxID=303371 RepID=A0A836C9H0_9STRA|nr:hypothetical protein JKP88DRAFT_350994 [Tribonema minus]